MNRLIIIICFIFLFVNVNGTDKFDQRKIIEENAILENILSFQLSGRLLWKYLEGTPPEEQAVGTFWFAAIDFYNDTDLPQWYKQALHRFILSGINILKSFKLSKEEAIKLRDQNNAAFEETIKLNCVKKETYMFASVMHSYIAPFEEETQCALKKIRISPDAEATDILMSLSAFDKYSRNLLFYFYKENNNQDAIRWLNKISHITAKEEHENIVACLAAFRRALEKENQRVQSNDIEPVFYLVVAALAPSYRVPESFLREFRIYLIQLAENAKKYHSPDPQFLLNEKRINEAFNKILKKNNW